MNWNDRPETVVNLNEVRNKYRKIFEDLIRKDVKENHPDIDIIADIIDIDTLEEVVNYVERYERRIFK